MLFSYALESYDDRETLDMGTAAHRTKTSGARSGVGERLLARQDGT